VKLQSNSVAHFKFKCLLQVGNLLFFLFFAMQFQGVTFVNNKVWLVMELMAGGVLFARHVVCPVVIIAWSFLPLAAAEGRLSQAKVLV
jgi:hypothetical protein